jgi:hypothetical protein
MMMDIRVGADEVRNNLDSVVALVNTTPGPRVLKTPGKGYGLFAERPYQVGECVAVYGGPRVAYRDGDYVVQVSPSIYIDGYAGFLPTEKGRWINDDVKQNTNVELKKRHGKNPCFYATRPIALGEEILWWYGPGYHRPWLAVECAVCGEQRAEYVCGGSVCGTRYCSDECSRIDWDIGKHHAECK